MKWILGTIKFSLVIHTRSLMTNYNNAVNPLKLARCIVKANRGGTDEAKHL